MGTSASTQHRLYRPFNVGEFTVAWLTFKGDAVEEDEEEQHDVAKKDGLVSSKLLRGLFGDMTMQCFEEVAGNLIPKEAFVCILALFYEGTTEDRISYIFTMYGIIFSGETINGEGFIAEKDYLYLLNYLEDFMPLPKQLYAAFEECMIPMAGMLSNSQFVTWARQYSDVMEFLAIHLPPTALVRTPPASVCNSEEILSSLDPFNNSPSYQNDSNRNSFSSFDFIGGEDSCDDDSDGLYDSDHLTEMEMSQSSFHDNMTSTSGNNELTSAVFHDNTSDNTSDVSGQGGQRIDTASVCARNPTCSPEDSAAQSRRGRSPSGSSRSRGVRKMGRYMGKAVGGGISRVGHVGRSILHVGKSQGHNQHSDDPAAGFSFSSESQSTKKYVCGYLHKISDSKWGKKRSWHRRWFVLDRQRGVLSYYRHNPANHRLRSSSHGNIVHMVDSPVPPGEGTAVASRNQLSETKRPLFASPTTVLSATGNSIGENDNNGSSACVSGSSIEAKEAEPAFRKPITIEEPMNPGQQREQDESQEQQQTLLYLNETHPWYRGALDLNMDNVSLLFEKTLARNAPTRYFFQVSTLALHDIDSKRGVQYKLCADTEIDFNIWTSAIAAAIDRKDAHNGKANNGAPVLSHQQLYRQRLLQKKMETEAAQARDPEGGFDKAAESGHDSPPPILGQGAPNRRDSAEDRQTTHVVNDAAASPHVKRNIPPRIVTQFSSDLTSGASCWHLHIHVDGTKQCLIVGFMLNIVAIRCLASEHVLWKVVVCLAVSGMFVLNIYNPGPLYHERRGSYGDSNGDMDKTLHGSDISQCSDPAKCCVHKMARSAGSDREENNGQRMNGSTTEPRQRSNGASTQSFAKVAMGSTMTQSKMQANGRSSNVEHSWTTTRAEAFAVRSSDYKKSRKKEPSKAALFEFLGADFIRTDSKLDLISARVEFPPEHENRRLFIINAQLPSYGPSVWGDGSCDGPGYSLALYWKIPDKIFEELKNPQTTTLKLLKRFLEAGNDTSLTDRFKVIAQVTNQDECGITGMSKKLLMSHNATPVLTRPQHRIYHFQDECTEIVVDVHAFSYIARRGIYSLIDKTSRLVIDLAFVIQGEAEEELPEQVLGCCRLDRVNVQKAVDLPC